MREEPQEPGRCFFPTKGKIFCGADAKVWNHGGTYWIGCGSGDSCLDTIAYPNKEEAVEEWNRLQGIWEERLELLDAAKPCTTSL